MKETISDVIRTDIAELGQIEESKAAQIKATFEPMVLMLESFEKAYDEVIAESDKGVSKEVTAKARRLRIAISKVRIETEKLRKKQKEEYLRAGKAIDGVSNVLKWAVVGKENALKEIENHFELEEKKRLDALQDRRVSLLDPYVEDAGERDLSSMEEDVWAAYLGAKMKEYNDRIAAEKKAEADRIAKEKAEAKERERIKLENEQLKKETDERERVERVAAEKRAKAEAARLAKERAEQAKRDEAQRLEREAYEKQVAEEKAERERLEAELRAKEEAERAKERAAREAEEAKLMLGDDEKVENLLHDIEVLKSLEFTSGTYKRAYRKAVDYLNAASDQMTFLYKKNEKAN